MAKRVELFAGLVVAAVLIASLKAQIIPNGDSAVPESYRKQIGKFIQKHPNIVPERYLSIKELDRQGAMELKARGTFPKLVSGDPSLKTVALTFDDGPYPSTTLRLLDVLKKEHVSATMFNIGYKAVDHADLVQAEVAAHQEVANHTFSHLRLPSLKSPNAAAMEIVFGERSLRFASKSTKKLDICRPPGGQYDYDVIRAAKAHGYTIVLWTDDPGDYQEQLSKETIADRVLRDLRPGAIILLHDGVERTLDVMPEIIQKIKSRGYKFVTCSEMLSQKHCVTQGGPNTYLGSFNHRSPHPK